jgi:hypothetical protein
MGSILILRTSPCWLPGSGNNLIFPMAIEWWKTAGHRHGYVNGHWMASHGWWVVGGLNMNNLIRFLLSASYARVCIQGVAIDPNNPSRGLKRGIIAIRFKVNLAVRDDDVL